MHKLNGFGFVAESKNLGALVRNALAHEYVRFHDFNKFSSYCPVHTIDLLKNRSMQSIWRSADDPLGTKMSCDLLFFVIIAYRNGNMRIELKKKTEYSLSYLWQNVIRIKMKDFSRNSNTQKQERKPGIFRSHTAKQHTTVLQFWFIHACDFLFPNSEKKVECKHNTI